MKAHSKIHAEAIETFANANRIQAETKDAIPAASVRATLYINPVIYAELSIAFKRIEELETTLQKGESRLEPIPREALFLAGKAFAKYRKQQGGKTGVLPDFFISAHAAVAKMPLLTRDKGRYARYFPTVELIKP